MFVYPHEAIVAYYQDRARAVQGMRRLLVRTLQDIMYLKMSL